MGERLMVYQFINQTESIGRIIEAGSSGVTGSVVATIFCIMIFLFVVSIMFGIPLEFFMVLILPFCIACAAFYGAFLLPIVVIVFYVAMIIAKNFLFR
jgi:hypothetical protein